MSVIVWTILVTPVVWLIYKVASFILDVKRRAAGISRFPSPDPFHWFLGHIDFDPTKKRSEELLGVIRSWNSIYPRGVNQFWLSIFEPAVYIRHPNTIKQILKTSEPKPRTYKMGEPWLGDGLLLSKGNKWARNRRLLTPAFHFDILKPYMDIYNDSCDTLVKKMKTYAGQNEVFDMYSNATLATLDVMLRCAMSYENDAQIQGEGHPYVKAVIELGELWHKRIFDMNPVFQLDFFYKFSELGKTFKSYCDYVHGVSNDIINKRRELLKLKGEKSFMAGRRYLDFLDILLTARDEDGIGLSHEDIRAEVDTFLFEGHDTTASALAWTLYMLAKYPEHQRKCQEEIDKILEGRDNNYVQWDDLSKLKYTTMCLKESMRLNTTVPWIQRCLTKPLEIDGVMVDTGTLVQIDLYALHNHQDVWETPNEYKPERFLDTSNMDPYAYVPFSAGPRNCIGQNFALHELKVTIVRVLRRFNLEVAGTKPQRRQVSLVMRAIGGLPVKLTARDI